MLLQHAERRPRLTYLAYFFIGALTMLSFAPFGIYIAAPLLLLPFFYASLLFRPRAAAWSGFWFGAGLFLTGTYWLYISIHVFGQAPLWVAILVMLALVMLMAVYYGATAWLINRLSSGKLLRLALAAPAVWILLEWLRGWLLSGFPWMSLGYGQIDSLLAGFAPVLGVYGIGLMLLVSAVALFVVLMSAGLTRIAALIMSVLPWIAGGSLEAVVWTESAGPGVQTTIVQGGISQDQKWLSGQAQKTLALYWSSLDEHPDSELIIWPEVALPATIDQVSDFLRQVELRLGSTGQSLLLGILERDIEQPAIYNTTLLLDGQRRQIYRKHHLVPFGEFFPVPSFVRRWMRMMSLPNSDLSAGAARQPLLVLRDGNKLAVAICYEDAYAAEQLYAIPDATILINVSNDAWFGDSIAPHQHLEIARMRALESGRNVVRSTNNGISAFIGPDGTVLESGLQFEYVAMTRNVTPLKGTTPYVRVGNWPVVTLCLLVIVGLWYRRRSNRASKPAISG